ncbi:hypothetical protein MBLNU457_g0363t1 [Dothideomycetes sp. NU457]
MNGTTTSSGSKSTSNNVAGNNKPQSKPNNASKSLDGARKQAPSPVDGASSSKKPSTKAWTGTNPITQAPNGTHTKTDVSQRAGTNDTDGRHAHDRLLFLLANFTGMDATVTLKNGEQFAGVFSGATTEQNNSSYVLKMTRRTKHASTAQLNGDSASSDQSDQLVGQGPDHAMAFNAQDVIDLSVPSVNLSTAVTAPASNGVSEGFKTDTEISRGFQLRERELQRWQPGPENDVNLSLGGDESGSSGAWDQFAANERLYGLQSDYNEDIYTTAINRQDPRFKEKEREAERIAREIEKGGEARKQVYEADSGMDEEDKYSGVRRETPSLKRGPGAYVPPSQRSNTSKPEASNAHFDPAIISSQIARPDSASHITPSPAPPADLSIKPAEAPASMPSTKDTESNAKDAIPTITTTSTTTDATPTSESKAAISGEISSKPEQNAYMKNVYESFKQFTSSEKLRVQQQQRAMQAQKTNNARQEKSVKLNDLKKFSQNFKLHSRVPEDLVPILAKTKERQDEIREKAEQHARDKEIKDKEKASATSSPVTKPDAVRTATAPAIEVAQDTASPSAQRTRVAQGVRPNNNSPQLARGPGSFTQRVAQNQAQYRAGMPQNVPSPIPMPGFQNTNYQSPGSATPAQSGLTSPTSSAANALRFNVKAMEFRPNPSASTFTPGGASDTSTSKRPSVALSATAASFFSASKKPSKMADAKDHAVLTDGFNPIKRMLEETAADAQKKAMFAGNGGIPQAYRTPPTWDVDAANEEKGYNDMFPRIQPSVQVSPMPGQPNGIMPHQHQLPIHLQGAAPSPQGPQFYPSQGQGMGHMENQRMPYSQNNSVHPSPRMTPGHPQMMYPGQVHPQMQGFPYGMPPGAMSPAMAMRPMPGGQYVGPQGTPMGGHMMMQQGSNGPYMNAPGPQQMYPSPGPGHAQPHFAGPPGQHQMQGGYGGSPRGHPMSHQGSQQGHTPQPMFMMPGQNPMMMPQHGGQMNQMRGNYGQPQFGGQGAQHPYGHAMQHRAMSNSGYNNQMTPRGQHAVPQQVGPPHGAPMQPSQSNSGTPNVSNANPGNDSR